jgi:hypothetical protein
VSRFSYNPKLKSCANPIHYLRFGGMRGAIESAASQRESRACRIHQQSLQLHLLWPVQDFQPEILDPISFSLPQGSAHSAGPAPKGRQSIAFSLFWCFLLLPKNDSIFILKKLVQKCKNHGFGGPQTLPKRTQNPS